jgi:transcriptional regulator with XRE-family HTH domain
MTTARTDLGESLPALIRKRRRDAQLWGKRRGLTQAEAAARVDISPVWWRQIETRYTSSADPATIASMCASLHISPAEIRECAYREEDAHVRYGYLAIADMLETDQVWQVDGQPPGTEEAIRAAPGLKPEEADLLIDALHQIRRHGEPLGRDIWRRE